MAKKQRPEGKKYSYMDTYGDLVTLLMCFFVLLFAMSTIDEAKYNAFADALSNRFGPTPTNLSTVAPNESSVSGSDYGNEDPTGETPMSPDQTLPEDFSQLAEAIEKYIEENEMQGDVHIEVGENGTTFLRLSDNLLFAGDSSALSSEALTFLDFLGESFLAVQEQIFQVRFLGHTASIPGSGTDDWILSQERSGRVASYFERTVGFPPVLMQATGYGRHFPIADNALAEGIAKNRRVDIIVISNNPATLLQALAEASSVYFPDDSTEYFEGDPDELPQAMLDEIPPVEGVDFDGLTDEQIEAMVEILQEGSNSA